MKKLLAGWFPHVLLISSISRGAFFCTGQSASIDGHAPSLYLFLSQAIHFFVLTVILIEFLPQLLPYFRQPAKVPLLGGLLTKVHGFVGDLNTGFHLEAGGQWENSGKLTSPPFQSEFRFHQRSFFDQNLANLG